MDTPDRTTDTPDIGPRPMGRPSKYRAEFVHQARVLCEHGATDAELRDFFEIGEGTLERWAAEHPNFRQALKLGKEVPDDRVERSLYQRAIGYKVKRQKVFLSKDGDPITVDFIDHIPPDVTACIFWLKNRRRNDWRDVHKHEVGRPGDFDNMTEDQLRDWVREQQQAALDQFGARALPPPPTNGQAQPH